MKIFDRINIAPIIRLHLDSFYNLNSIRRENKKRVPRSDIFTFLFLPIIISLLFLTLGLKITYDYINVIITSLSIFAGLLFSLLTLVFDLVKKEANNLQEISKKISDQVDEESIDLEELKNKQEIKVTFTNELFQNIAFAIALSIMSIIISLTTQLKPSENCLSFLHKLDHYTQFRLFYFAASNFLSYFLVIQFLLALMMILKRFFRLYLHEKS